MNPRLVIVATALALSLAACGTQSSSDAQLSGAARVSRATEHSPYAITPSPDNDIWFAEYQSAHIGKMTPGGEVQRFSISDNGFAERITWGPDQALWFTDPQANRIGRLTADGHLQYVELPTADCGPTGITAGADGYLYFSEHAASRIGKLGPNGTLTEIMLRANSGPAEITAGSDGAIYFVEDQAGRIGRLGKDGKITEWPIPTPRSVPGEMAATADGTIYFAEIKARQIGKMSLPGKIHEYMLPEGTPLGLAAASDGNIWVTAPREHLLYRIQRDGRYTAFRVGDNLLPGFITSAPDGYLYFSDPFGRIGRVSPSGEVTEFDVSR